MNTTMNAITWKFARITDEMNVKYVTERTTPSFDTCLVTPALLIDTLDDPIVRRNDDKGYHMEVWLESSDESGLTVPERGNRKYMPHIVFLSMQDITVLLDRYHCDLRALNSAIRHDLASPSEAVNLMIKRYTKGKVYSTMSNAKSTFESTKEVVYGLLPSKPLNLSAKAMAKLESTRTIITGFNHSVRDAL